MVESLMIKVSAAIHTTRPWEQVLLIIHRQTDRYFIDRKEKSLQTYLS